MIELKVIKKSDLIETQEIKRYTWENFKYLLEMIERGYYYKKIKYNKIRVSPKKFYDFVDEICNGCQKYYYKYHDRSFMKIWPKFPLVDILKEVNNDNIYVKKE